MNDTALQDAYRELATLTNSQHVPEGVKAALFRLQRMPDQALLHCSWESSQPFPGHLTTTLGDCALEPSNLLHELLMALRAFEWQKVLVLVHDALSDKGGSLAEAGAESLAIPWEGDR